MTSLVTVKYKETLVSPSMLGPGQGYCGPPENGSLIAVYEIEFVDNSDRQAHDFTLDISRLYSETDINPGSPTLVPWNLVEDVPVHPCSRLVRFGSNDLFVAAGSVSRPIPGTETFIIGIYAQNIADIRTGVSKLMYRSDMNQHVLMIADVATSPTVFDAPVSIETVNNYGK